MKTRTLFVTALLGLGMMASCSNDELEGVDNGQNNNGETTLTQIALSVASSATTKAGTQGETEFGKEEEYTVNDLTVLLANENGIVQQIITPDLKPNTGESTNAAKEIRATEPFKVTPGDYYIYVLANYNNSRVALSPIIQGQTALKEIFSIAESSISELSESGNFLMANTTTPTKTTIAEGSATSTEIKDDGAPETDNPQTVQLIKVDIERVVGKVTFNQTTTTWTLKNANDNSKDFASVTLNGAGLINLNKKMYLVKGSEKANNKPVAGDWAYPKDPNYDKTLTGADGESTWLTENFANPRATITPGFTSIFYCPENTMASAAQQNGQTTGVVYKATWTPNTSNGYTTLDQNGSDVYSQRFKSVLDKSDKDSRITSDIFTKNVSDQDSKTFYTFGDLIFKNKYAACLYKCIVEKSSADDINSAFTALVGTSGSETSDDNLEASDIYKYSDGVCYYPVWIKHNPTSEIAMEQDKYGVVRNHWYELTVTDIKKLGVNKPTYDDPDDPDDPDEVNIQVQAKIKEWTRVYQDVEL